MSAADSKDPHIIYEQELLSSAVINVVGGLLETHGITRRELARRLEVKESRVSRILNGRENMTLATIASLGRALGVRFALAPIPYDDRGNTPAADDPPPPRWLAGRRRLIAEATTASGLPSQPGSQPSPPTASRREIPEDG